MNQARRLHGHSRLLRKFASYYDYLGARFGFEESFFSRLTDMNILYDEDDKGSFFQLYSRAWGGELFFEIVQRVEGYQGYGAPNAPFRIAAQRRELG